MKPAWFGGGLQNRPRLGVACFVGNLLVMSLLAVAVRELLSRDFPLGGILLLRYLAAFGLFLLILVLRQAIVELATRRPLDHAIRSVSGVASLGLLFFALSEIPLADATALSYAAPIFIALFSIVLLDERIGWRRWGAIICGFVGVVVIAQPTGQGLSPGVLAAAGSAVTASFVVIWLRKLASSESPLAIGIYYNALGCLVCLGWVLASQASWPDRPDVILLLAFGLGCGIQQWLLTVSFRYAEASLLAPFEYLAMVFAAIAGFWFFDEIPVLTTWVGALIIAASGLFIFQRNRQRH